MAAIRHPNVVLFMGVCLEPACLVTEWCSRGSVFDILVKARKNPNLGAQLHSHRPHILHRYILWAHPLSPCSAPLAGLQSEVVKSYHCKLLCSVCLDAQSCAPYAILGIYSG